MERIKGIDGLRAIAVLMVFTYHASPYMKGGWVGVDIFFVISGFVITRMLKLEFEASGRIDFAGFYVRRLLRLWPALLAMACFFVLVFDLPVREWLPAITYTANFIKHVALSESNGFFP